MVISCTVISLKSQMCLHAIFLKRQCNYTLSESSYKLSYNMLDAVHLLSQDLASPNLEGLEAYSRVKIEEPSLYPTKPYLIEVTEKKLINDVILVQ